LYFIENQSFVKSEKFFSKKIGIQGSKID
jgi:hypothetical protein